MEWTQTWRRTMLQAHWLQPLRNVTWPSRACCWLADAKTARCCPIGCSTFRREAGRGQTTTPSTLIGWIGSRMRRPSSAIFVVWSFGAFWAPESVNPRASCLCPNNYKNTFLWTNCFLLSIWLTDVLRNMNHLRICRLGKTNALCDI